MCVCNIEPEPDLKLTEQFGECIGTSRWPEKEDVNSGSEAWKLGVVNNYKVQDALKKPSWLSKTQYGQPAEMVYRLLTVPMEYSTFATTAQLGENPEVSEDINLEFSMNLINAIIYGNLCLTSYSQFTITSTVGLEVTSMDTCLRFPWRLSTQSSGFTTGKSILALCHDCVTRF